MRSKALALVRPPDRYKKDLAAVETVSVDQLSYIAEWLSALEARPDPQQTEVDLLDLSSKTGLAADKFFPVLSALRYTRDLLARWGDAAGAFVADLVELQLISANAAERFRQAVERLPPPSDRVLDSWRVYGVALPVYDILYTRCLLLPTFDREYRLEDDAEKYSPRVQSVLPAIAVNLGVINPGTDETDTDQVSFIVTEPDIDDMVMRLELAKKQLDVFKSHLKVEGSE